MKSALVVIFILISTPFAKAEGQEIEADLQKLCKQEEEKGPANIKLLDKHYTQSPNSTLIPDVKQILKLVNKINRQRSACRAITQLMAQGNIPVITAKTDEEGRTWEINFPDRGPAHFPGDNNKIYKVFIPAMKASLGN